MKKVGIFGLTANPVHFGHKDVVEKAAKSLDEVWINPVFVHPWGKKPVSYEHRKAMCELMFGDIPNVKTVELDKDFYLEQDRTPYSYDVLVEAKKRFGVTACLIIGQDNFEPQVWQKFYKYKEIEDEFGVFVLADSGTHSTDIREMVKNQQWEAVANYCGENVVKYMYENKLYLE